MLLLGTGGGFGMHGARHTSSLHLAPNAAPKLVLIGVLVLFLVLWVRMYLRSLERH
jgi:hypothetical protein